MYKLNFVKRTILLFSIFQATFMLTGCKHKSTSNLINPEFIGIWKSDNGCSMTLAKNVNTLVLLKYTDSKQHNFTNIRLKLAKDSIGTKFSSLDNKIPFSGLYLEGEMIIDNYCNQPLHKIGN